MPDANQLQHDEFVEQLLNKQNRIYAFFAHTRR